jgi:ketol-acid reductoisomerase
VDVTVALREGSSSWSKAENAGLKVASVSDAVSDADLVMILAPDEFQQGLYESEIKSNLKPNAVLAFAHGFNIHFKKIIPTDDTSVIMIAPKGPGHTVRSTYLNGGGVPSLIAIYQDGMNPNNNSAKEIALSYAKANGGTRAGVLETTFKEETETYFECLHETKLIVDLIHEGGIANMHYSISNTAEFGDYVSGPEVITDDTKEAMRGILKRIQTGEFADNFLNDCRQSNDGSGGPIMKEKRKNTASHSIEQVGAELRSKMKFLHSERLVNKDKN